MTVTPLPPLPEPNLHGGMTVSTKGKYQATEDGYTADQTRAYATQSRTDLEIEVQQWKSVFGHLGTADECGNEWIKLQDENQRLREALDLALEYWKHRQQRYKNRLPVWVELARAALEK